MWRQTIFLLLLSSLAFGNSKDYEKHSLNWPTKISDSNYKFGPNMHQYQHFPKKEHYFHGGVDVVSEPYQKVFAPAAGYIDGGYYAYNSYNDGTSIKRYISLNDLNGEPLSSDFWGERYFELSITDLSGNRFEFHHIDRTTLPREIKRAIKDQAFIQEGMEIGNIIPWPNQILGAYYNHLHYNVYSPDGTALNPYWFSEKIKDTTAPEVSTVYYQLKRKCPQSGRVEHHYVSSLEENDEPTHIVIKTKDIIDGNHFPQAPTKVHAKFSNGETYNLDFSYSIKINNERMNINDVYTSKICIGSKTDVFILEASSNFDFFMKIPLPENFSGTADVSFSDFSGNETNILVNIKNSL